MYSVYTVCVCVCGVCVCVSMRISRGALLYHEGRETQTKNFGENLQNFSLCTLKTENINITKSWFEIRKFGKAVICETYAIKKSRCNIAL